MGHTCVDLGKLEEIFPPTTLVLCADVTAFQAFGARDDGFQPIPISVDVEYTAMVRGVKVMLSTVLADAKVRVIQGFDILEDLVAGLLVLWGLRLRPIRVVVLSGLMACHLDEDFNAGNFVANRHRDA